MESTMSRFESIANHALAVHRDDVIDEVCDWLESHEAPVGLFTAGDLAPLIREWFDRG